jgi:hypothetical protein
MRYLAMGRQSYAQQGAKTPVSYNTVKMIPECCR